MKLVDSINDLNTVAQTVAETLSQAIQGVVAAARVDDLTELKNATAMKESFAELQASVDKDHYFYFGDLNGFKDVNDRYGHSAGDAALRHVGKILAHLMTTWEFEAYHKSGDEFILLVSAATKADLDEELKKHFSSLRFNFQGESLGLTGSFGCVKIDDSDLITIQNRAESACSEAKRLGVSEVVVMWSDGFTPSVESRRVRCDECSTSFRCEIPRSKRAELTSIKCPVCSREHSLDAQSGSQPRPAAIARSG